ncbi:hypothetical protein TNCV_1402961 [Trichonephila clavipes]|nr:hypothetical protein TNCV_1402961 [Trichonephila clavipes]
MNERIVLEEEMRLKERWLVEELMRHVQEKHEMRMKEEQKCLPEERGKRRNEQNQLLSEEQEKLPDKDVEVSQAIGKVLVFRIDQVQMLSADRDAVAQPVAVEKKKGLSNAPLISAEDETRRMKKKEKHQ